MSHQALELGDREESTRTVEVSVHHFTEDFHEGRMDVPRTGARERGYSPRMPAVTPEEVLRAGCHHLVLDRILFVVSSFACLGESEGLEGRWILVYLLVHMDRKSGNTDMGTLGDERAV